MKTRIVLLLVVTFLFFNCSKEDYSDAPQSPDTVAMTDQSTVTLKFPLFNSLKGDVLPNRRSLSLFVEIAATLRQNNGKWELFSDQLTEIECVNSVTGEKTYGYVFNGKKRSVRAAVDPEVPEDDEWGIYTGLYGFNGICFIWGKLIVGQNGESIFIPADYTTQMLLNVCPEPGSLFAETPEVDQDGI